MNDEQELTCPITLAIFRDPVQATDGHVYEREAITRWIQQHGTSPITRQILHVDDLTTDNHLKELAAQYRKPSITSAASIKVPKRKTAIVHPTGSRILEQGTIRHSSCEKNSWAAFILMSIMLGGIISIVVVLFVTVRPRSGTSLKFCTSPSSQTTTLLQLINATRFNYTYYSFLYQAKGSNDTIVFSFRHDTSYWCLDDISMINMNSKMKIIQNGGFENGVLTPFRFCSNSNAMLTNPLYPNTNQHSGVYSFCYKSISHADYLIQTLNTTKGQMYIISFWIKNRGESMNRLKVSIIV